MGAKTGPPLLGQIIGWSILLLAVLGVLFWYFARPALEERGYSVEELKTKSTQIRESVNTTVGTTKEKFKQLKSKTGETSEYATEKAEIIKDKTEKTSRYSVEKAEKIKDKTEDTSKVIFEEINLD